jgi:transcriptional regulator with XRE-family HTH domain
MPRRVDPQPGLGRAIRQLREERGLSQEALGQRADLHMTWISRLEAGRNVTWGNLKAIARSLEVRMADLAALAEEKDAEDEEAPRRDPPRG